MKKTCGMFRQFRRFIFTDTSMGLAEFREFRTARRARLATTAEQYWSRISHYFLPRNNLLVYTEDFKNAIALAETDHHLSIVEQLCRRYYGQSVRLKLFVFHFGPVVMRLLHELKRAALALQLIKDEELTAFFDHAICYALCMDLLFKQNRFTDMVDVWRLYASTMSHKKLPHPRSLQILITGALYKLGSREAYDESLLVLSDMIDKEVPIVRKALCFIVALCLKVNEASMAMELLALLNNAEEQATSRSLMCIALARLGRFSEAIELLDKVSLMHVTVVPVRDRKISRDVLEEVKGAAKSEQDKKTFNNVQNGLRLGNCLLNCTIDDLVSVPVFQKDGHRANDPVEEENGDVVQRFIDNNLLQTSRSQTEVAVDGGDNNLQELLKKRVISAVGRRIASEGPFEA